MTMGRDRHRRRPAGYTAALTFPVVLGARPPAVRRRVPPTALRLAGIRSTRSDVALHTYELAGRPTFGSIEDMD
jgi:hypothetical protein